MTISERAKFIYVNELQQILERENPNQFVAIEPDSRDHFVAPTFVDAALAAKKSHPDRTSFVIRIGHEAAFHIGTTQS